MYASTWWHMDVLHRALTGGGIFITTVVLGTVILVTKARPFKIGKEVVMLQCVACYDSHTIFIV